jgi:hypothetical protein
LFLPLFLPLRSLPCVLIVSSFVFISLLFFSFHVSSFLFFPFLFSLFFLSF